MSEDQQILQIQDSILTNAGSSNKLEKLISLMENILKKNIDSRNATDHSTINKFIANLDPLTQIAQVTYIDAVKNIIKFSRIHDISKNRILYKDGSDIDRVLILLSGKFGLVKTNKKIQNQANDQQKLRTILQTSPLIIKQLKRKKFYINFDLKEYAEFKTVKANMYELDIKQTIQKQGIFDLTSLVSGKKYQQTLVSLVDNCKVLSISSKLFYQIFQSSLKKKKADKLRIFRKFQCFNLIEDERLLKIVQQLNFIYRQGQEFHCIYLLFTGSIKITKTIQLFKQDPNNLYLDRKILANGQAKTLPYADLSSVYNYKPRQKIVQLGVVSQYGIFGEEQYFSKTQRQANAQVSSQQATFYQINLKKFEQWLPQKKGFVNDFTDIIYANRTEKKILYRQQKLSEIMLLQNKNNMDYFFIQDQQKRPGSVNKFKINKVNQVISPQKSKSKPTSQHPALYNNFNFQTLQYRKSKSKSQKHYHLTQQESKVTQLIHNYNINPSSSKQAKKRLRNKKYSIDIHNPLFQLAYFTRNQKQALRIQKQSRKKLVNSSIKSSRSRPRTSSNMTARQKKFVIQP